VAASDAARLFAPGSLFFRAGPGFRWSILNYGRITNSVRAQDARFQQALVNYENTVLKAAQEVEDALIDFLKAQESAVDLQRSVDAGQRSVELSIIQYQEGAENFQRVGPTTSGRWTSVCRSKSGVGDEGRSPRHRLAGAGGKPP
jgi:outer membrane protein TolC